MSWSLVCPFLNDSPDYAYGVELGMLYSEMKGRKRRIKNYFTRSNQEQICLLANRLGWTVKRMKNWDASWFWCVLEKR